jgi:hypothetical protein
MAFVPDSNSRSGDKKVLSCASPSLRQQMERIFSPRVHCVETSSERRKRVVTVRKFRK